VVVDYTVPANRRAIIGHVHQAIRVTTALVAGQYAFSELRVTPNLAGVQPSFHLYSDTAAPVGSHNDRNLGEFYLSAGDRLAIDITVTAGAGAVESTIGAYGIEFDA